ETSRAYGPALFLGGRRDCQSMIPAAREDILPGRSEGSSLTRPTSPVFDKQYAGFLFDLDGTLLNSIAAAERVWSRWALAKGLDLKTFLPSMHGRRGIDTIRSLGL